ncbi:MAG: Xaa-Pro peptidase family protein [Acidobacteriota bacterium]
MNRSRERIAQLLELARSHGADGALVTHPPNLFWLLGFSGSAGTAVLLPGECKLIVDGRYGEQARQETTDCEIAVEERAFNAALARHLPPKARLAVEADHLTWGEYLRLREWHAEGELLPASGWIEELRMVKCPEEIELLETAFRNTLRVAEEFQACLGTPASEKELAGHLEFLCRRYGSEGPSFPTIVASEAHSALPHAAPRDEIVAPGRLVLVDFGMRYRRYCSDLTRVFPGDRDEATEIVRIVREAHDAAIAAIKPGAPAEAIDRAARAVIEAAGYGEHFLHSTGHGVGLEIHEAPRLGRGVQTALRPGMVVTVEPGIYLPGRFGVRIEDMILVTETGARVLAS